MECFWAVILASLGSDRTAQAGRREGSYFWPQRQTEGDKRSAQHRLLARDERRGGEREGGRRGRGDGRGEGEERGNGEKIRREERKERGDREEIGESFSGIS